MQGDFHLALFDGFVYIHRLRKQNVFVLVEVYHKFRQTALIAESFLALLPGPFVFKVDDYALVEIRHLPQTVFKPVVLKLHRFKNFGVGAESDCGAGSVGSAHYFEPFFRLAAVVNLFVVVAVLEHFHNKVGAQRVDDGNAHAVQTARHGIASPAELAAGVQFGQHDFHSRKPFFFDYARRYAPAVVGDGERAVGVDSNVDFGAVACKRLVDGVVHYFHRQVVQTFFIGGADIHAGSFADGFQPFQHLYLLFRIIVGFVHITSVNRTHVPREPRDKPFAAIPTDGKNIACVFLPLYHNYTLFGLYFKPIMTCFFDEFFHLPF